MRANLAKAFVVAGLAISGAMLAACESDGGEGRSHDWRNHDEGIRPAQGGTSSGEGRGVEYLKRTPNTGREAGDVGAEEARPSSQGGVREATPR